MVSQKVLVRDKWRKPRKFVKFLLIFLVIVFILLLVFFYGVFKSPQTQNINRIVLENPLKNIVFTNTNVYGEVNKMQVIKEAVLEFDEDYINYVLIALGVSNLHKSNIGYGNPVIKFVLGDEVWISELEGGNLVTENVESDGEDLMVILSKQEAVEALLASDVEGFMKDSVVSGRTEIEMIAGKVELASKGYLSMYKELTGEEVEIEE